MKDNPSKAPLVGILPFASGFVFGLFVAFIVFIFQGDSSYRQLLPGAGTSLPETASENNTADATGDNKTNTAPALEFEFHKILPAREIKISEWVAEEQTIQGAGSVEEESVYILQVGSFKQKEAADQVKAQLALLGISADIQRFVINDQDTRCRVRIGPYTDQQRLNNERRRIQDNNLEFMTLKLQADDQRVNEG